jgi:riboflavin kinase/FMN adenylyltransferase
VYAGIAFTPTGATRAAINIGLVPTFRGDNPLEALRIEAFLLDYHGGDLYDQSLRLTFTTKLRDEQRFEGPDALVAQIHEDIARTRELVTLPGTDPNAG